MVLSKNRSSHPEEIWHLLLFRTFRLTSGLISNMGSVGPVPAMGIGRGLAPDTCFNIIDTEFPGFSTYCSVLPQTTYSLPNFFGHQTKFEANDLLSTMKSTLDSGCFSHVRMFVCPLFFPPCSSTPVLPCAQFCESKDDELLELITKNLHASLQRSRVDAIAQHSPASIVALFQPNLDSVQVTSPTFRGIEFIRLV